MCFRCVVKKFFEILKKKLQHDGKWYYYYDKEGNLTNKTPSPWERVGVRQWTLGSWAYEWNANGSLKKVKCPDGKEVTFAYDALGRRTKKVANGKIKRYLWDGNVLLHEWEYNVADEPQLLVSPIGEVTFDKEEPIENLITWVYESGSFVPIGKLTENERFSIVSDYIGRPVLAFDENGEKVWSAEYDIYGKLTNLQGDKAFIPFRQLGQYEDGKTGLTDNGPLMVTHGCLRVYNKDMPIIQKIYTEQVNKGKKVYVYVEETADLKNMFTNYGTKPDPKDTITRKNKKYDPQ